MSIPTNPDESSAGATGRDDSWSRTGGWSGPDSDDASDSDEGDRADPEEHRDDAGAGDDASDPPARRRGRWTWGFGLAVVLVAVGLATTTPTLVVAGVVPLAVVAYAGLTGLPATDVSVTREFDFDPTAPGEPVEIEVTVRNGGDATLPDVRVVDLVPEATPVRSGSPRASFVLAPGESGSLTYTLGARRGVHEFGGVQLRVRNDAGTALSEQTIEADGDDAMECDLRVDDVPLVDHTSRRGGAVTANEPGEGLEFYSVREYRRGDAISDIDWRRYARSGELTTVRYREERATTVVLLVDARDEAYVSETPEHPSGAKLSAFAAGQAFEALETSHHEVGLGALFPGSTSFVDPGRDTSTIARVREVLESVTDRRPLGSVASSDRALGTAAARLEDLESRVPGRAQIVLFSPATDRFAERMVRGLQAHGYPVTLFVPSVLGDDDAAQRVLAAEQERRLVELRGSGARVVEWDRDEALPLVLERAMAWGESA